MLRGIKRKKRRTLKSKNNYRTLMTNKKKEKKNIPVMNKYQKNKKDKLRKR